MNYRKYGVLTLICVLLIFIQHSFASDSLASDDVKNSVVQIFVESSVPDYVYPWQVLNTEPRSGSGFIIDGNQIMTAAHVVDNSLSIYVRKAGSDKRYKGVIKHISDASDLAIITIENDEFFKSTTPLRLGKLPELGDEIITWGFPEGGTQIAITKGIVSRIDFSTYTHSGTKNLVCQIDAAISAGASGGAAIVNGTVAGVTFQALDNDTAKNVGYVIPTPVINQFLKDISDGRVDGIPTIAIKTQKMRNLQIRNAYNMKPGMAGVLVVDSKSEADTEPEEIKTGDVLLQIDGFSIGNDGTVPFISGDRIDLDYFLTKHQIGDTTPIRLLRDGKEITINYTFKYTGKQVMLVTRHYSGFVPDYEVVGGLVFQELNHDYMFNSFEDDEYPAWMSQLYDDYKNKAWDRNEKIVFISSVLPDEINVGYDSFEDRRVKSVNGKKIDNLDDFRHALNDNESQFHVIQVDQPLGEIILNKRLVQERARIIRERYGIHKL